MTINQWIAGAPGRAMNPDNTYGLQCKDVIDDYCLALFGDWVNTIRPGNAKVCFDNANPAYFDKVVNNPNDSNQTPPRGAICVLNGNVGAGAGHIFVVTGSNPKGIDAIEQDGFKQIPAYAVHYNNSVYNNMIGWLIPKVASEAPTGGSDEMAMTREEEIMAYRIILHREPEGNVPDGRTAMQFILDAQAEVAQREAAIAQASSERNEAWDKLNAQATTLTDLTKQVSVLQNSNDSLVKEVARLQKQVALADGKVTLDSFSFGELIKAAFSKLTKLK